MNESILQLLEYLVAEKSIHFYPHKEGTNKVRGVQMKEYKGEEGRKSIYH